MVTTRQTWVGFVILFLVALLIVGSGTLLAARDGCEPFPSLGMGPST